MNLHGNARLTPHGRALMCRRVREQGWTVLQAAQAAGCSERTCYRWLARFDVGEALLDRSSAPRRVPGRTPAEVEAMIERLRRLRFTSTRIAAQLGLATSTVCAVLTRLGLGRLSRLEPPEPANRYCRRHPGELVHVDVKKLGRFTKPGHRVTGRGPGHHNHRVGWEAVHVCVDDTSRLAYVEVLPDETAATSVGFLGRAVAWFAARGITVSRVMTDNGAPYKVRVWAAWCADHDIRHIRTRPYRPRTNGKAERFIQTMLREWSYAATYQSSDHRAEALPAWLDYYNNHRPHSALGHKPPASIINPD
ncbi:MAG TPA: IS481 family transposase [Acidimicrobiales bacterium]|nr:IS481 family transposase [Acidimicrobiales bacterium]